MKCGKWSEVKRSEVKWSYVKISGLVNVFVVFVVAGCIVDVSCSGVIYCCVFVPCLCFVCILCYLSVVLLYYCHRVKTQLQFNIYIYIYLSRRNLVGLEVKQITPVTNPNHIPLRACDNIICAEERGKGKTVTRFQCLLKACGEVETYLHYMCREW
jgi:hypothetical protein